MSLSLDLSQHISCWNDYGGWYNTDHINLVQGSAFAGSLQSYKGSLYWNNVTYPFPLTTNTNVLDIGDKTPMPLPLKLYITPVGAACGVVIKAGEVIARIHMYKIANTAPDATKASGVGVSLMRNGKILATGENVSLGTVNKSKVPLGLSATYGQTGNKVSAGTVQSVIGVTFIYE